MFVFLKFRKQISAILIIGFLIEFLSPALTYAAPGPAKPEAAQFEPVDATDLVNLFTGDFAYNLPLMEVPGPEGGWPINMSYHSGIGPNTEPTWVGLGWTLNPGAVNRFVSGFPDDNYAGFLESKYEAKVRKGTGVSLGVSYFGAGMSLNYDSYSSKLGVNTSASLASALTNIIPGGAAIGAAMQSLGGTPLGVEVSVNLGASGVGLSAQLGVAGGPAGGNIGGSLGISGSVQSGQKPSASRYAGIGTSLKGGEKPVPISLMGVSYSSASSSANFSVSGVSGFSGGSSGVKGQGHSNSSGFSLPIPLGTSGWFVNIGFSQWSWWLREIHRDSNFGMIQQAGFYDKTPGEIWNPTALRSDGNPSNSIEAYNNYHESLERVPDLSNSISEEIATLTNSRSYTPPGFDLTEQRKFERNEINEVLFSSEDIYQVSVQGIAGTFRPYFDNHFYLYDNNDDDGGIFDFGKDMVGGDLETFGANIHFRFDNDQAFSFRTFPKVGSQEWFNWFNNSLFNSRRQHSKQIIPAIDPTTGTLRGFEITDSDGKKYEFYKPVYNYYQYTETKSKDITNSVKNLTPYATSWLLTGIKGPDYVDEGLPGYSSDDYGFWVHFIYEGQEAGMVWRTPYKNGEYRSTDGGKTSSYSSGISENIYLKYIETSSHLAEFKTSHRYDSRPASISEFELPITSWSTSGGTYSVSIPYDKQFLERFVSSTTANEVRLTLKVSNIHYYGKGQKTEEFLIDKSLNILSFQDPIADNKFVVNTGESVPSFSCDQHPMHKSKVVISCVVKSGTGTTITSNQKSYPKLLYKIHLFNKIINEDGSTNYPETIAGTVIEGNQFHYNYELQKGNENSVAPDGNGKLTLVSVQKLGVKGISVSPPTSFSYDNNPIWNVDQYTPWNNYSAEATIYKHLESNSLEVVNRDASAWNLTSISNPFGSQIQINYESDKICNIKSEKYFDWEGAFYLAELSNLTQEDGTLTKSSLVLGQDIFDHYYSNNIDELFLVKIEFSGKKWIDPDNNWYVGGESNLNLLRIPITSFDDVEKKIYLSEPITFYWNSSHPQDGNQYDTGTDYPYDVGLTRWVVVRPRTLFAGGSRVKTIILNDKSEKKITKYRYYNGTVSSLPDEYRKKLTAPDWLKNIMPVINSNNSKAEINADIEEFLDKIDFFYSNKFNQLGPSPSVGYKSVEVYDVRDEDSDVPTNGKMVQKFYTADDALLQVPANNQDAVLSFIDRSGLIGQMKATEQWGEKQDNNGLGINQFYLARYDSLIYRYSSDLTSNQVDGNSPTIYWNNFSTTFGAVPLGITQQNYYSKNEDNTDYQNIIYRRENVFLVGTQSRTYFYDQNYSNPKVSTLKTYNIGYDAATGGALVTVAYDSEERKIVSESTPANWLYPGMRDKNMLTQKAQSVNYLLPGNYDFTPNRENAQQFVSSASVTTWKNWNTQAWRQNDQYVWVGKKGQYTSFDQWSSADNEEATPESHDYYPSITNVKWQRTSNIVSYDRYSHPIETRSIDGQYSSARYGFNDALVVSAASNARLNEFVTEDFEDKTSWNSYGIVDAFSTPYVRSGTKSLRIEAPTGSKYCLENNWRSINGGSKTYRLSGWIYSNNPASNVYLFMKNASGTETNTSIQTTEKNKWVFLEKVITLSPGTEQVRFRLDNLGGGSVWFDDLRLVPDEASVVNYTYDPVTQKVTSITDQNNITAFFIYDPAGRLIKVLDKDKNIVSSYQYNYGK